ncbi:MAG: hypothetical protein WBN86_07640 [Porticoccaceae bacterium]
MATNGDEATLDAPGEQRVPCAPVLSVVDTIKHPCFIAREMGAGNGAQGTGRGHYWE